MNKPIEHIFRMPAPHFVGDGFKVHTFFPAHGISMQRMNPFLMMDYNASHYFPPTDVPRGVDVHPHRGFETVTIAYKGKIAHHDSAGNSGIIHPGDVQWMTAASGVLHKEYHEESFSKQGGELQMVQLWVNLPAKAKMTAPKYQEITNTLIPKLTLEDEKSYIEIIAGTHKNVNGKAFTFTEVHLLNGYLEAGITETFEFNAENNTAILVLEGEIELNSNATVESNQLVLFKNEGTQISVKALQKSVILVLSATPIHEPIAAYGPFVMNTQDEIAEAIADFRAGKFGELD